MFLWTFLFAVVESLFMEENFYILQLYHVHWYFTRSCSSRNCEKSTGCKVTKNELLTNLLKSVLKKFWNFSFCSLYWSFFYWIADLQTTDLSAFHISKIMVNSWDNVCWGVPFKKQSRADSIRNSCSKKLFKKLPGKPLKTPP